MLPDAEFTQGDVPSQDLTATLKDGAGNPVDLTSATQIKFWMRAVGKTSPVISGRTCTKVNPPGADGKVKVAWSSGDLSDPGDYLCEFEVVWSGGRTDRFPTNPKLLVRIHRKVG